MPRKTTIAAALALVVSHAAFADITETVSEGKDREAVAVTIYNENLALVREARKLPLNAGANRIALRDVSARIMPETALPRAAARRCNCWSRILITTC